MAALNDASLVSPFLLKLILSEDDDSDVGADPDAGRIDKSPHNNKIGNTDDKRVV